MVTHMPPQPQDLASPASSLSPGPAGRLDMALGETRRLPVAKSLDLHRVVCVNFHPSFIARWRFPVWVRSGRSSVSSRRPLGCFRFMMITNTGPTNIPAGSTFGLCPTCLGAGPWGPKLVC